MYVLILINIGLLFQRLGIPIRTHPIARSFSFLLRNSSRIYIICVYLYNYKWLFVHLTFCKTFCLHISVTIHVSIQILPCTISILVVPKPTSPDYGSNKPGDDCILLTTGFFLRRISNFPHISVYNTRYIYSRDKQLFRRYV